MPAVFISYSRRDTIFVRRLHDALAARQYDVWVDWEDIPPSAEWFEEIRAGVRQADGFIYVISPDSVSSEICSRELDNALDQNKRVVPVVCREPDGTAVPERAAALNWVFLRETDDFDTGLAALVTALETDLDHVRVHTRLGVQADRWQSSNRDASLLLRGSDLSAAEAWLVAGAGKRPEATQLQREYLLASRQAGTRRQRIVIGGVSVALAVAVVLAVVALIQRSAAIHERNVAFAGQLDANAQANYTTDPELSVLLAARAAQVQPGGASEATLRKALAESAVRARYPLASDAGGDVIWSPDDKRVLITSPGVRPADWARIYTPGSSAHPVTMPGPSSQGVSGWDAAGNRVVIGGGLPAVYDAGTGRLIRRLPGTAIQAALTRDGSRAVTVDVNSVGHVYDVATGRELASFRPHYTGGANCFALSPDDRYVAQCDAQTLTRLTGNPPAELDVWSTATGRLIRSLRMPALIGSVSFSPDSQRFVLTQASTLNGSAHVSTASLARSEGQPGTLVYNTLGGGPPVITFPDAASVAAFGPNAQLPTLVYATLDDVAHVYQFTSKRLVPLTGASDRIDVAHFDASGGYVVTASADNVIRIYNASVGGSPIETLAGHRARIMDASIGDGDEYVASSSNDGTARLWAGIDPLPSVRVSDSPAGDGAAANSAFSPNGQRVIVAGRGRSPSGLGRIFDAGTLRPLTTFSAPAGQVLAGAQYARDGRVLSLTEKTVARQTVGAAVESFNAGTGKPIATMIPGGGYGLFNAVSDYEGNRVATVESRGRVEIWDTGTGRVVHTLSGATTIAAAVTFSRDGTLLAAAHYPALPPPGRISDKTSFGRVFVQLWNTRTGALERTIMGRRLVPQIPGIADYAPLAVAFSPDGRLLALSGADTDVEVFSTRTDRLAHPALPISGQSGGEYGANLAFSPNGRLLAAGGDTGAYIWQLPSYGLLPVFQHVTPGSAVLTGGIQQIHVGFTADSGYLVTLGDLTLEAWNVGEHLQVFHDYPVSGGSMNAAGTELVATNGLGISVYPCDLCGGLTKLEALARRRVTRGFTASERASYLKQG